MLLAAGCGGEEAGQPASATASRLTTDDLRPLVTVSPEATGWTWRAKPETRVAAPEAFSFEETDPSYEIQKALHDAYEREGLVRAATSSWRDGAQAQKASSFANLLPTPEAARSVLEAERTFAHAWFPEIERVPVTELDADGLGETSWAVRGGADTSGFVEIGWARANAVLSVYLTCRPCATDVAEAAQRWAEAIDEAARAAAE